MQIVIDRDRCEGLGMCEAMAHEFFEVDDDGVLNILDDNPTDDHRQALLAATNACPVSALTLKG